MRRLEIIYAVLMVAVLSLAVVCVSPLLTRGLVQAGRDSRVPTPMPTGTATPVVVDIAITTPTVMRSSVIAEPRTQTFYASKTGRKTNNCSKVRPCDIDTGIRLNDARVFGRTVIFNGLTLREMQEIVSGR